MKKPTQSKIMDFKQALVESCVGRESEVELVLAGLLAQEHVLFVGPPGTGKSMLADNVALGIGGNSYTVLLSPTTEVDEIMGPLSLAAMKQDRRERVVDGTLCTADIGVVDEVWKGNSAVINSMLKLMNERKYKQGTQWVDAPLRCLIGASNEWPIGEKYEGLGAAFDRFLFRKEVLPVSRDLRESLIMGNFSQVTPGMLSIADVDNASAEAGTIPIPKDVIAKLLDLIDTLEGSGIYIGDRRMRKAGDALLVNAYLNGHDEVCLKDFEILQFVLWGDPEDQRIKCREIVMEVANPHRAEAERTMQEITEIMDELNISEWDNSKIPAAGASIQKLKDCVMRLESIGDEGKNFLAYTKKQILAISQKIAGM